MQPASAPGTPPSSPCISPIGTSGSTLDPNWQATKPTVRERNAAMFNNDLMADVRFIVGGPGSTQVCLRNYFARIWRFWRQELIVLLGDTGA